MGYDLVRDKQCGMIHCMHVYNLDVCLPMYVQGVSKYYLTIALY